MTVATHELPDERAAERARAPLWARAAVVVASVALSLVAAELVAGIVRGHAFPVLNIYMSDPAFGVRLEPDATTHLRSRHGHITEVSTNALGLRGPLPSDDASSRLVVLLGDSQVFGYGVDEEQALAARLAGALGPTYAVLNAAVPTWGPPEYVKVLDELAATYRPRVVVYFANIANDWSEAKIENAKRTGERDGWARIKIAGEESATDFPGRRFLLGQSHLVYALRMLFAPANPSGSEVAMSPARVVADLAWLTRAEPPHRSRVTPSILAARDIAAQQGAILVVAILPLDVQVHPTEWSKYGDTPEATKSDVGKLFRLNSQLVADMQQNGIAVLDLLVPLREASPGAFQEDDYHLAPRGHEAVARALTRTILENDK